VCGCGFHTTYLPGTVIETVLGRVRAGLFRGDNESDAERVFRRAEKPEGQGTKYRGAIMLKCLELDEVPKYRGMLAPVARFVR
jgi:hypothetical protein